MDIQEEREAFELLPEIKQWISALRYGEKTGVYIAIDNDKHEGVANWVNGAWFMWQAKAQAMQNTQALHDRLLAKSIREHVESHISEISVNDLFDKGWLAAMKCIQNNIDMLEAQEQK